MINSGIFLRVIYHLLFVMCVCQNKIDENYFFCVATLRHRGQVEWKVGQCDAGLLDIFDENKPTHLEYKKIKHYNNTFIHRAKREKYWFGHVIIEIKFSLTHVCCNKNIKHMYTPFFAAATTYLLLVCCSCKIKKWERERPRD